MAGGWKGGWTEGEGKAGWALEADGAEKGPGQRRGRAGGGRGAVRCRAAAGQQPGGGPPVPGRYMLSSRGTAPAPCLMAAVGAARGLHVLIFLPLLLLLLFHFIREQLMAYKWQRDGQGTGRGRGRRGWGGVSRQLAGARGPAPAISSAVIKAGAAPPAPPDSPPPSPPLSGPHQTLITAAGFYGERLGPLPASSASLTLRKHGAAIPAGSGARTLPGDRPGLASHHRRQHPPPRPARPAGGHGRPRTAGITWTFGIPPAQRRPVLPSLPWCSLPWPFFRSRVLSTVLGSPWNSQSPGVG